MKNNNIFSKEKISRIKNQENQERINIVNELVKERKNQLENDLKSQEIKEVFKTVKNRKYRYYYNKMDDLKIGSDKRGLFEGKIKNWNCYGMP